MSRAALQPLLLGRLSDDASQFRRATRRWKMRSPPPEARALFTAFGTCSISGPIEGLLGLAALDE